ncbi:MAG: 37S ribosomal protein S16, mitochondrial [Icmadophila ericetorum]|nr:37S ribosomal protein S16, mitochondrial [Icmadophila ericetorum]
MVLKIRLARFGKANAPFYNIVVAKARSPRNSKPLEVLGTYDPVPKPQPFNAPGKSFKDIKLDTARAKYWLGVGAQPTDMARRLLSMLELVEPKLHVEQARRVALEQVRSAGVLKEEVPTVKAKIEKDVELKE